MGFQKRPRKTQVAGNQEPLILEGDPVTELEVQGPKGVVVVSVPKNLQQWMRTHFAKVSVMLANWHEKMGPGADPAEFRKYVDSVFTKLYGQTVHLDVAPSGLDFENMNPEQLAALYALLQKASGQELKSLPANIEVGEFHKVEGEYDGEIDGREGVSGEVSGSSGPRNQGPGLGGIAIGGRDSVERGITQSNCRGRSGGDSQRRRID